MKVSLVVVTAGKAKGQAIPINLPQFIIGRDPQCNLRPASAVISKRHCALLIKEGKVFVRDFNSTNGTFVNEVQVSGEVPINHEDVLKLGPLEFKMVIEAKPTAVTKQTPLPPQTKPKPTPPPGEKSSDDDSVAAMLLSIQDDGGKENGEDSTSSEDEVPGGSTVMDIVSIKAAVASETPTPDAPKPPAPEKKPDPKNDPAHLAAKAILEKYNRRTR